MPDLKFTVVPVLIVLAGFLIMFTTSPAKASILGLPQDNQPVQVSIGFNTQVPLPDLRQETLANAQKAGREYLYRLGQEECALLKATIAKTCRLTNLNINTQVQQQHHNIAQLLLYINGSANFIISLKDEAADAE